MVYGMAVCRREWGSVGFQHFFVALYATFFYWFKKSGA